MKIRTVFATLALFVAGSLYAAGFTWQYRGSKQYQSALVVWTDVGINSSKLVNLDQGEKIAECAVTDVADVDVTSTDQTPLVVEDSDLVIRFPPDIEFTIAAAEGVSVEWSVDGGATWTAYAPGAKAPAGDIQIRLKEGKFGVKTLNMTLSADNNAFDVSDVEIPKTIPLAKWSDSFDGESAASTKVGGSKISYMGDWQNPQYVEVRDGSDKAVVIADNCSPYKTSLVAAGSDFSFLTVAKMFRSKTKSSVISYFGGQSSGLYLVYNDKKVKLVDRASSRVIAEYADANVERQFHAYLVTFDNETKTVQFFVDGVKIEPKSTDTVDSHPGTGYQLGAIFGGANLVVDDVSTQKGIDIEVDEIAIWDADVGEVAPEIAEKFPVWPEEEDLPALVDVALEPGKNTTVSQIVLNGKVVDGLDEKEREGDTIEVTFAANARYAFAEGEDGVRTVMVGDEAVTITGPDADYFIDNVYATGKAFDRFVLENGEVTQLEEGDTIICDAAHWEGTQRHQGPNISAFAAHLIVFRQEMDCGAGAGIPANGQIEIDFNAPAQQGVYLYGDIGESARVSGKGILYLGHSNNACTINDGVEISANVSFQSPVGTVTINGAVKITGAVDATYGLFKLADGAELTVAKLDDGKVVTDVVGKKVVYADGRYMLVSVVTVTPQPEAGSTAKVYQDGVEVTGSPVKVERDSAVDVVFMAAEGYCFEDHSTVQTNTVTATDNPTSVDGPTVVKIPSLKEDEVGKVEWEAETTITVVSTALKSGDKILDKGEYEYACEFYGITPKTEPTAEDFKVVPKDAQIMPPAPVPPDWAVTTWDALTNAVATAESGATVAVGADIAEAGGELVVPTGKAVAIKLYGKTVSCGLVTVGGALTVGDAEDSVGRIVASDGAKLAKSGSVTLLNGPVRGTFTTKSCGVALVFR